jgi:cytochrome c peroxidase
VIKAVVEDGLSLNEVARIFRVGIASAIRWVKAFDETRRTAASPTGGDRRSVLKPHRDGLLELPRKENDLARVQVPTLCDVDKRPDPSFVGCMHNGYFTSLRAIVHYYNTRDVLPRCKPNDAREGTTCWPAPESTDNMNTKFKGRLGLLDAEDDALVAFMQTLTDGFMPR